MPLSAYSHFDKPYENSEFIPIMAGIEGGSLGHLGAQKYLDLLPTNQEAGSSNLSGRTTIASLA